VQQQLTASDPRWRSALWRWGPLGISASGLAGTGAAFAQHWSAGGHAAGWALPLLSLVAATLLAAGHAFGRLPHVSLGIVSLGLTLACGELLLRATGIVPSAGTEDLFRFDGRLGWRLEPGARVVVSSRGEYWNEVRINAAGWRDRPVQDEPPGNRPLVAVLGDSFVTNLGVRDAEVFTDRLDRDLPGASVRNFGVNGYGQVQELLLLEEIFELQRPDLALVVVYVRNDFDDNTGEFDWIRGYDRPHSRVGATGELTVSSVSLRALDGGRSLGERVFGLALYKLAQRLVFALGTPSLAELSPDTQPPELRYCRKALGAREQEALRTTLSVLDRMRATAWAQGSGFAVAVAPTRWQVDAAAWHALLDRFELDPANYERQAPQRILTSWCRGAGVPCLDLLPDLETSQREGETLYHAREQHWTAAGNAVVARSLLTWLGESGLSAQLGSEGPDSGESLARR